MAYPIYPVTAQCHHIEGVVELTVQVGVDGKVLSVATGGEITPVDAELRSAAKENASQWTWGPFPPKFQFPWYRSITYTYKLQGKPTGLPVSPAFVQTDLPSRIEIIASPCTVSPLKLEPITPRGEQP